MEDEACATATGVKPKPMSFTKADELKQEVSVLTTANQANIEESLQCIRCESGATTTTGRTRQDTRRGGDRKG